MLKRLIPDAQLEAIDDAGHLVIEERPEELLARIMASTRLQSNL